MKRNGFAPLVIILVIAILGTIGYFVYSRKVNVNTPNVPAVSRVAETGEQLAYVNGYYALPDGGGIGGDLWVVNVKTLEKKRITTTGNIDYIFDWSPDNKYIAVQLGEKKDSATTPGRYSILPAIAVVELSTGRVVRLKEDSGVRGTLVWYNPNELIYLHGEIPKDNTFSAISVKTKSERDLMTVPKESGLDVMDFHFSPDMQSLAALTSGGETPYKFYSYSAKTNQTKILGGTESEICGWISDKIIFSKTNPQDNGIWEVNTDGTGRKQLVDFKENKGSCLGVARDVNKIIFTESNKQTGTDQKIFSFDYKSGITSNGFAFELPRSGVKVSKDGNYASSDGVKIINLNSGVSSSNFCEGSYCFNYSWSN